MEQIKQALDRLSELSAEELAQLEGDILTEFDNVEQSDVTEQSVASMNELADALDTVRGEIGTREEKSEALFAAKEAAIGRVKGKADDAAEKTEGEPDEAPEAAEEPDAVAASAVGDAAEAAINEPVNTAPDGPLRDTTNPVDPATQTPVSETNDVSTPPMEGTIEDPVSTHLTDESALQVDNPAHEAAQADTAEAAAETKTDEEPVKETKEADEAPKVEDDSKNDDDPTNEDESKENTVTASGAESDITPPADRQPAPKNSGLEAPVSITAGADIPGVSAGSPLPDMKAVAAAMSTRMHAMRRTSGGDGEQHTVASLIASFPEERVLRSNEQEQNGRKIEAATDSKALVAAGGICAPVAVRYDLFELGGLGRPVRDSLPSFNADRGGIRYVTPPTLNQFAGAVALWTLQDDIDASTEAAPNPVKPCIRIECGAEVVVMIDAITLCLTFGNMGARAYPELVKRNNELGLIQHARFAETRLLTRIGTLSTAVSAGRVLGAARDFFNQVERAAAAYRSRHRMEDNAPLRVIVPTWLKNLLRSDLVMQMPGDGNDDTFALADATINRWFSVRYINVTWHMDGETGQIFGAQPAGALLSFPNNVIWYLFAEGTFLFLDGGTLDLGLVRDSTLNGTNDYKMFVETFEGVAKVGIESLRITSRLEATGAVAGTVDTSNLDI